MRYLAWFCALIAGAAFASERDIQLDRARAALHEAPPAPPGYATPRELQEAVNAGKHERLGPADVAALMNDHIVVERDVEYGRGGGISLTLDLFRPARMDAPAPALLFVHGGGWKGKGKGFYDYWCARYAGMGYVCATIEYRTSNEAIYPAAVQDVNCAVRWMRANATHYNVDPYHVALIGQSAGAHLALMAAYADDGIFQSDCVAGGPGPKVQAVVNYYGPVDLMLRPMYAMDFVQAFLGATFSEAPERYKHASPVEHVSRDDPPTLIVHGTIDGLVRIAQGDILAEALEAAGVPCVYDRIEGWDHGMEAYKEVNEHCMYVQDRFLATYLPLPPQQPAPIVEAPPGPESNAVEPIAVELEMGE